MAISSLLQLDEKKAEHANLVAELRNEFTDRIVYQEELPTGETRRPIFVLESPKEQARVEAVLQVIQNLEDEISVFIGKRPRFNTPTLCSNVLMCRVWENTAVSSSTETTTKEQILNRLKKTLTSCRKYTDNTNLIKAKQLEEEIEFFENETETVFRKRSLGNREIVTRVYYHGGIDERIRVKEAGLYLVGFQFDKPKIDLPNLEKKLKRKSRPSVFDHNNIQPIKFSGAINTLLYRESDVQKNKEALGFSQSDVKDKIAHEDGK